MLIKYEKQNKFKLVSEGFHQAVCKGIYDLGLQENNYKDNKKTEHKVIIAWELDERVTDEGEHKGKRYVLTREYTVSLYEKANLRRDLSSWRGRDFTEQELQGFDLKSIIGANCWLEVVHNGEYANIKSVKIFKPLMQGQELPQKMVVEDISGNIPKWIQAKIDKQIPKQDEIVNAAMDTFSGSVESVDDIPFGA